MAGTKKTASGMWELIWERKSFLRLEPLSLRPLSVPPPMVLRLPTNSSDSSPAMEFGNLLPHPTLSSKAEYALVGESDDDTTLLRRHARRKRPRCRWITGSSVLGLLALAALAAARPASLGLGMRQPSKLTR